MTPMISRAEMLWKENASTLYNISRKYITLLPLLMLPVLMSPFGLKRLRGMKTISMNGALPTSVINLVGPALFIYTFTTAPLSSLFEYNPPVTIPQIILAAAFLAHYVSHLFIDLSLTLSSQDNTHDICLVTIPQTILNALYGAMMGSFLTSPFAGIFLNTGYTFTRPTFYIGAALWIAGFAGSVKHAEIMLTARQNTLAREKKDSAMPEQSNGGADVPAPAAPAQEPILRGGLYEFVSQPRPFLEWIQWLGYALMAAPRPPLYLKWTFSAQGLAYVKYMITGPAYMFAQNLAPPYIILLAEICLSLPVAHFAHIAMKEKFGERYPANRRAIVPFVF